MCRSRMKVSIRPPATPLAGTGFFVAGLIRYCFAVSARTAMISEQLTRVMVSKNWGSDMML